MNWNIHVTVAAIIEQKGRFLLVEERIDGQAVFNQPAGHLEAGETLIEAVIREVEEETAHVFRPEAVVGIYLYDIPSKKRSYLRICFCGQGKRIDTQHALDADIIDIHWLSLNDIQTRSLRSPLVLQGIRDYLQGQRHPLTCLHHLKGI